ncbi:DNA repair exonuclease [Erwinia sp. CPCC 100877]|nr:DNA repair exonuclease [Erwinia sp. CPCC 100877]
MKILHTADLHLDRAFEGLKSIPSELSESLQKANPDVLKAIVEIAIKSRVDAVIFAGDTFHQSRTSIRTQAYFIDQMKHLEQADIPVFMTFGNHDYYIEDRYWFAFPKNLHLFQLEQVETHYFMTKNHEKVAVSGFSYEQAWINENKLAEFPPKDPTVDIHIGIYHGDTTNSGQQNYAPFSIQEMKNKGYDYWALGHIHQPQIISAAPLIVYPGTPQGHTKKERAVQGVALANIENGHASVSFEAVAEITWHIAEFSLEQAQTQQAALQQLVEYLTANTLSASLVLTELQLTNTEHLGEEFRLSYESGELLHYLQTKLLMVTQKIYLHAVTVTNENQSRKTRIKAAPDLLKQLEMIYLQPDIFSNTLEELLQNPLFTAAVQVNDEWRKRCVQQADQKINEDFVIQEDQS